MKKYITPTIVLLFAFFVFILTSAYASERQENEKLNTELQQYKDLTDSLAMVCYRQNKMYNYIFYYEQAHEDGNVFDALLDFNDMFDDPEMSKIIIHDYFKFFHQYVYLTKQTPDYVDDDDADELFYIPTDLAIKVTEENNPYKNDF